MKKISLLIIFFVFLILPSPLFAVTFQISNFQKTNDFYSVDVELGGASTDVVYIQAAFTPMDKNSYFGYTWGQKGEWFQYLSDSKLTKEYIKENFAVLENNKSSKILLKPDLEDPDFNGPGEYILKLKRYTGESTSGTYSNSLNITLADIQVIPEENTPSPTQTSTPTSTSTPTPTVQATVTRAATPTPTPTKNPTFTPSPTKSPSPTTISKSNFPPTPATEEAEIAEEINLETTDPLDTASVAGETFDKPPEQSHFFRNLTLVGGLLASVSAGLLYLRFRGVKINE